MNFMEIARSRQSCRSFDENRAVEREKLDAVLDAAILAPSACNGQPYHFIVCTGQMAKDAAKCTMGMGFNKFADKAPVIIVILERPYIKTTALGARLKKIDYRSIDIGIAAAYLTAEATAQGLDSCILGWIDDAKLRQVCQLEGKAHLVIALGYAAPGTKLRKKIRKDREELITFR